MNIHLSVQSVTKLFSRDAGVRDVSCDAATHDIVGIAGRNGAGKSTLIKIIAGVLTPVSGTVAVTMDGTVIDADALQNIVGLVGPYLALYDEFTPNELLAVTARLRGLPWSDADSTQLLERVQLREVATRIAHGFSSGMMQRLRFAVALQHQPPLLLLDEPTSNLDDSGIAVVKKIIDDQQQRGITLIASNDDRELAWCTKIVSVNG